MKNRICVLLAALLLAPPPPFTVYLPLVTGGNAMPFPSTPILDYFDRADEMPLNQANWQDVYGVIVNGNRAEAPFPQYYESFYATPCGPACDAFASIPTIDTGANPRVQAKVYARRDIDAETGYNVTAEYSGGGGTDMIILERDDGAGGSTNLAVYNVTLADGDKIGIRCSGNNISAYHYTLGAWALLGTQVDATYPGAGLCGVFAYYYASAIGLDDFGAGDYTGAAFPEPGVTDNFNRANEGPPPSASWRDTRAMGVVSNQCAARQTPNAYAVAMLWRSSIAQLQEVWATVPTRQGDTLNASLFARSQDVANTLALSVTRNDGGADIVVLAEVIAGAPAMIGGPYVITYQDGDSFGIRAYDTTIEAWYKAVGGTWTLLGDGTTALPPAAGKIGLYTEDTVTRFSAFGGGVPVPDAPTNLAAVAASSTQINLTWADNSLFETGFKIERKDSVASPIFAQIATVGANIITYSDAGLAPGVTYTYRVRAYSSGGDSAYTNEASATTMYTSIGYSIITPDGVTYNLTANGLGVNPGIPDGFGLVPITHRTSKLYRSAGALLNGIDVEPRIVTITISAIAGSQEALHAVRAILWAALRWNRTLTDPPPPSRLRYTANGHTVDLYVHYLSDVQGNAGNANNLQLIGVRLIAYDPMWYSTMETNITLDAVGSYMMQLIIAKIGAWDILGPPNAAGGPYTSITGIVEDATYIYVAGSFENFDNIGSPAADYVARYNKATGVWSALAATGADDTILAMVKGPDGRIYVGGDFLNIGGVAANYIAVYDPATSTWSALGAGTDARVGGLAFDNNGVLYVAGDFLNAGGAGANRAATWTSATATWAALGAGLDDSAHTVAISKDGTVYYGGAFHLAGGGAALHIASWNPVTTTWAAVGAGTNSDVREIAFDAAGNLYAVGWFTVAGGIAANRAAMWNGAAWVALSSGLDNDAEKIFALSDGTLIVAGSFSHAGGIDAVAMAKWNGTTWCSFDITLPGSIVWSILEATNGTYYGTNYNGIATASAITVAPTTGDAETFPIITITGPGTLQHIINETSGEDLAFNLYINAGEVITIDLSPGVKSITSSWTTRPGNAIGLVLPASDLGVWSLKPAPVAPLGVNTVSVFMTGTTGASAATIEYYNRWLSADEACK